MNRWLQRFNLLGVILVVILCVVQWKGNRALNLEINRLEKMRIEQTKSLDEQSKKIKGYIEDLEALRGEFTRTQTDLKEERGKARDAEVMTHRLIEERDQLKTSVSNWANAVAERDTRLKEDNERLQKLSEDLKAFVKKFNDLATNYNAVVKDLNELRAQSATQNKSSNANTK